jgi:imidazolonepropionase-like amidohydrolase
LRLNGATYEEIARAGGGIASTVKATAPPAQQPAGAKRAPAAQLDCAEGVTTLEIKSGYGLALEHERKCLRWRARWARRNACGRAPPSWARMPCRLNSPAAPTPMSMPC